VDLLKRVYRCCQGLSADASHEQAAAAFIARFIRRVLRIISVESGNATPTMGEGSNWNLPETGLSLSTSLYAEPGGGVSSEFVSGSKQFTCTLSQIAGTVARDDMQRDARGHDV
jgi:hypothetical protein